MEKKKIEQLVDLLNNVASVAAPHIKHSDKPLPSLGKIAEMIGLVRSVVFPAYFCDKHIGECVEKIYAILADEIANSLCFEAQPDDCSCVGIRSAELATAFVEELPHIKHLLSTDVKAIFDGDPAAENYGEVILCYPSIRALLNHRVAHKLFALGVPILPRVITEIAHSETGIDIHPGARIGEYFAIDHGTGVVIGKTAIIGNHVRIYQGVTLGAKSFTVDEKGKLIDEPRHPILEDGVIVYSNTSVLGRVTIGTRSVIGGNIWLTQNVPPNSKILQQPSKHENNNQ